MLSRQLKPFKLIHMRLLKLKRKQKSFSCTSIIALKLFCNLNKKTNVEFVEVKGKKYLNPLYFSNVQGDNL